MKTLFTDIPSAISDRMQYLEERDARDRSDGTPQLKRLRQIPPETGMQLALLAASAPTGQIIEIGASGGYSSLWLALAAQKRGGKVVTFELLPEKAEIARETIDKAQVADYVDLVHGDARGHLADYEEIAFCFLDAEKEMYVEFYELLMPKIVRGGLLLADNVISHSEDLQGFVAMARADESVDAAILPVGKGLLLVSKQE